MEKITVDPKEYGLQETKAKEISDMFKPMLDMMVELEKDFNEVVELEITADTIQQAKTLRLRYVKVRTGTAAIHKDLKAFYLKGGKFVDGWKNAQLMASEGAEKKLKNIENHFIDLENGRVEKLKEERENILKRYEVEVMPERIGNLSKEVWENYLAGVKVAYDARKKAEKQVEDERIENLRIKKLHQSRKESLIGWWQYLTDEDREKNFGEMSEESFEKLFQDAQDRKKKRDEADEKVRLENVRLKKEKELKEKEETRIQGLHIQRKNEVIDLWDFMPIDKQGSNFGKWEDEEWNELLCFLTQEKEEQEAKQKIDQEAEQERRRSKMYELGLIFNGEEFIYKDINFHWTDLICMTVEEFDKTFEEATKRMAQIKQQIKQEEADIEAKAIADKEQLEKDLNKGDAAKMRDLIVDLIALKSKYKFKSKKNQLLYAQLSKEIDVIVERLNVK